jgi:hypothetical protein
MKPPIKDIDELLEMWSKDCELDETEPGRELLKISGYHSKYLRILTHHNLICKKLTGDYSKLKKLKWDWYSGHLNNPEDLAEYGFEPMTIKVLRSDIPICLDSDKDLNDILLKKLYHEEIVSFCQTVIKELNSRTWQLKSFIDWEKFAGGS